MIADDPFGAHGGSAAPAKRSAKARRVSSKIAKGLSAEAAPEKPTRRGSEQRKAPSGPSQEELQRKIEVLMTNPKLWQEFKQYLAESNVKGSAGTQRALREFIEQNEEIAAAEDAAATQEEQTKRTSGLGRSLLGAVNSLTSELEADEATPPPPQHTASTGTSRVANAARSSFSNASNMGMNFLRKAGEVATSSISGLDKEAEQAVEANESFSASGLSMSSLDLNSSSADFVGVLNEWFGDEKIEDIQEENEEDEEESTPKAEEKE